MDTFSGLGPTSPSTATTLFNLSEYMTSAGVTDLIYASHNETIRKGYVMREADKQRILIIAVIMAFTLIGNMTLILVLLCKRSRRIKRVNILLMNLAVGDLAVALFVNSTEILFIAFGDWALGPIMCKISVYVQMICLSSTTNLLTAMSIDRYQVIVKPMQSLAKRPRIWLKIAIAWILSLLFPIPQLFIFLQYNAGVKFDGTPRRICGSNGYTAPWQRKVYFTFTTTYILVVPMAIMLYCYVEIIRVVWIRANNENRRSSCFTPPAQPVTSPMPSSPPKKFSGRGDKADVTESTTTECGCEIPDKETRGETNNVRWARAVAVKKDSNDNAQGKEKRLKVQDLNDDDLSLGSPRMSVRRSLVTASKRRALIMTLTVVISFLVCHTPYFFVNLVRIYSDYQLKLETPKVMSEFLVMVHSTLNPLLYGLFTLRQYHLKHLLAFITCSRPPHSHHGYRQTSGEKHKLLSSVRSRLIRHKNSNVANTTNKTGNKKNRHRNVNKKAAPATPSTHPPQSSASTSTSILSKIRRTPLSRLPDKARNFRKGRQQQQLDALLFTNADAIHLTEQNRSKSEETEQSELESCSPVTPKDFSPCTLIANTHIMKANGSSPSVQNSGKLEVRKHGDSDVTATSKFTADGRDMSRGCNVTPWTPQDDEFIIGGLTRV